MKKKKTKKNKRNIKSQTKLPQLPDPLKIVKAFSREMTKLLNTSTKAHKDKKKYSRKEKHKKNFSSDLD
jgi:hypothetical protein